MSCKRDLSTLISEIEWLVKDHSRCKLEPFTDRISSCEDECYTMKITQDVFVKLHRMLHNYIGLVNFRGSKSRDFDCLETPLNEALDVAVRAMISAMQSSVTRQPSSTPGCLNCTQTSGCSRRQSVSLRPDCEFDKLPEIEEVDRKLQRLKTMNSERVENVEVYVKDVLRAITKLPLSVMTSRLDTLSSMVRNTKNKLTSCGGTNAGSLMGTQVNSISQIVSEFILEYGQTKSRIYPCRKICRFCDGVICPMDRQRNIFCCENARRLNSLWKGWIQQNSVKGVTKWDEDTIMSIMNSSRDSEEDKSCVPGGACATLCRTAGGRVASSRGGVQDGEAGDTGKRQQGVNPRLKHGSGEASDFFDNQGENKPADNRLGRKETRKGEAREIGSGTKKQRDSEDRGKNESLRENRKRDKSKGRENHSHGSIRRNVGEGDTSDAFSADKTNRKKGFKKDAGGVDFDDKEDIPRAGSPKKGINSGGKDRRKQESDLDPETKPRGKFHRKKKGVSVPSEEDQLLDDEKIGKSGQPSVVESSKKERSEDRKSTEEKHRSKRGKNRQETDDATKPEKEDQLLDDQKFRKTDGSSKKGRSENKKSTGEKHRQEIDDATNPERDDTKESSGRKKILSDKSDGGTTPGTKTREKHDDADGKPDSVGAEGKRGVKSGTAEHRRDRRNVIQYRLSNKMFIEMGWTVLPKDTVMRRVVEFEASLAKPHMNWLKNNKIHGKQYYTDNKTIFVNFLEDGSGHVYYPNGRTAIAAHVSKKRNHELYKVYAPGGRDVMGVIRLPWLMGVFDSMGNGVVYDENCDVRLTYNQNGGVYMDNPAKVPFSWGWNNFQTFPIDEAVYEDPSPPQHPLPLEHEPPKELKNIGNKSSKQSKSSKATSSTALSEGQAVSESQKSRTNEPVKVIPRKVITPLKPICLKMNKHLSLRILDRKNINLQFFAGQKSVRIELGTEVDPNVQINSQLVDRDGWTAKMTNRLHVNASKKTELNSFSPDNSLVEIAKEYRHAKNDANSRQLMIAKYRPYLIPQISIPSDT